MMKTKAYYNTNTLWQMYISGTQEPVSVGKKIKKNKNKLAADMILCTYGIIYVHILLLVRLYNIDKNIDKRIAAVN